MIRVLIILICTLSFNVSANSLCENVAVGYEASDIMYVVCEDLSDLTSQQQSQKIKRIFDQYIGPPDEVLVYFVSTLSSVGKPYKEISPENLVGVYYTHDSILRVWPNIESRTKEIRIKRW